MSESRVNFIRHLTGIQQAIVEDDRLTPWHISLYYALFHSWNESKFRNPVSINRSDLMQASKIGSANTYSRCIKELDQWGYIRYQPSKNPQRGSKVHMYRTDTCIGTSPDTSPDTSADTTPVHHLIQRVRPSINSINNKKQSKHKNLGKVDSQISQSENRPKRFSPPSIEELNEFFLTSGSSTVEAEKFFNHFESNGWLVGGKAKMKNWQAAARNWILNAEKFNNKSRPLSGVEGSGNESIKPGNLNVNQNKDYSIPL